MILIDLFRVLLLAVGIVVAAYQVALIRRAPAPGQRARLAGAGLAIGGLVFDRILHMGDAPTWRLVFTALVVAAFAYGSWKFRSEVPAQPGPLEE